ncbi:unnamed protein product [Closterium sp. Yama58-4]|nr:unnamed protein product [Closterium sp. Yama58-4]
MGGGREEFGGVERESVGVEEGGMRRPRTSEGWAERSRVETEEGGAPWMGGGERGSRRVLRGSADGLDADSRTERGGLEDGVMRHGDTGAEILEVRRVGGTEGGSRRDQFGSDGDVGAEVRFDSRALMQSGPRTLQRQQLPGFREELGGRVGGGGGGGRIGGSFSERSTGGGSFREREVGVAEVGGAEVGGGIGGVIGAGEEGLVSLERLPELTAAAAAAAAEGVGKGKKVRKVVKGAAGSGKGLTGKVKGVKGGKKGKDDSVGKAKGKGLGKGVGKRAAVGDECGEGVDGASGCKAVKKGAGVLKKVGSKRVGKKKGRDGVGSEAEGEGLPGRGQQQLNGKPLSSLRLGGYCVLLAEDTMVMRRLATMMLEKMGAAVVAVEDGQAATEAVVEREKQVAAGSAEPFDAVIMDCQMPRMDGYGATRWIRAREKEVGDGRHLPVVALTAHAMASDREHCLASGMDEYLTKPANAAQLVATLHKLSGFQWRWLLGAADWRISSGATRCLMWQRRNELESSNKPGLKNHHCCKRCGAQVRATHIGHSSQAT